MQDLIGRTLDHYRIVEKIGGGGMGVVYRAEDSRLDRSVALKFLPDRYSEDRAALERFQREARTASALNHPNICTIHDFDEHEGRPFIVLEYLEGETLEERIAAGPLELDDVVNIAIQVAKALHAAHSEGVIHRDIKPSNVFLGRHGHAKVLDFGLAKLAEPTKPMDSNLATIDPPQRLTEAGAAVGTAAFMSPEQVLGEQLDHRSDLFSLGIVLFEMATGKLPFAGPSPGAIFAGILHHPAPAIENMRRGVPHELEHIVSRCLEKDPDLRYQSAHDVLTDLRRLKRETSSDAKHSQQVRYRKPIRWGRWSAAVAAVVVIAAVGGWQLWRASDARDLSIAVLPFTSVDDDPNTQFLCDSVTQRLIDSLTQVPEPRLSVASWHAVSKYDHSDLDVLEIGKELKVNAVLTGSAITREDRMVLGVFLTDARTNRHIWGDPKIEFSSVTAAEEDISSRIVESLRIRLSRRERESIETNRLYQQARYYWNQRTSRGLTTAIELFEEVIRRDPDHAPAYAGLGNCYNLLAYYGGLPGETSFPRAREAATRALELDEGLAEAHTALALVYRDFDRRWVDAEREFVRAIQLDPNYETAHQWYAEYLTSLGRFDEALVHIRRAVDIAPLSLIARSTMGWIYYCARDTDRAVIELNKTLRMDPDFPVSHWFLGWAYCQQGKFERSLHELEQAVVLSGGESRFKANLGYVHAVSGRRAEAQQVLNELTELALHGNHVSQYGLAVLHNGLGDTDAAFASLSRSLENHEWEIVNVRVDPVLDSIRSDRRFDDLVMRLGLPSD